MNNDKAVSDNYRHSDLLGAITDAIAQLGRSIDDVTIDDLAPVDEFHIGGQAATESLLDRISLSDREHILDVGCGLGGAARFVASRYGSRVTGIDLTEEYIEVGRTLSAWVGLENRVALQQGSALAMPFEDASFDAGYMLHVGMNIEDKEALFGEIFRVLRPGTFFCVYDVMRCKEDELAYPVPWATEGGMCALATPDDYRQALMSAGFEAGGANSRREVALAFFEQMREKMQSSSGPIQMGIHILMRDDAAIRISNMIENIAAGIIAPVEIIAYKKQ